MRPTPFVLALLPVLFGAGFPKVVRVRVPTEAVSTYFPPGTQMRGLAREEFEALVAAAREGHARRQRDGGPRLIRARHAVRWEAGRLLGRSELLVEAGGGAAGRLALEPWTPAIDPEASAPAEVLNRPDGTTALRVPAAAGTTTVTPAWELRARPGSDGHVFALGLPRLDAAALVLDLPEGWIPEGPAGIRRGPLPGSGPDRRSWRFDGPGGATSLRLRAAPGRGEPTPAATTWVGGPIRI
ncbi:MAG TPA: hypothetical protein VF590_16465, partial [Isosphaeraceae bacterium]